MKNKVSVISTVKNEEENIGFLIDSILQQNYKFHEFVINDNNSSRKKEVSTGSSGVFCSPNAGRFSMPGLLFKGSLPNSVLLKKHCVIKFREIPSGILVLHP